MKVSVEVGGQSMEIVCGHGGQVSHYSHNHDKGVRSGYSGLQHSTQMVLVRSRFGGLSRDTIASYCWHHTEQIKRL